MFGYFYEPYSFVFLKIEKNLALLANSLLFSIFCEINYIVSISLANRCLQSFQRDNTLDNGFHSLPKPAMNCPTQRPCSDRSSCLDYSFPSDFNPSFFKCHNPCDAIVWDAQTSVFSYSSEHPFSFWPVPSFDSTLFLSSFFFFKCLLLYFKTVRPLRIKTISFYLQCLEQLSIHIYC